MATRAAVDPGVSAARQLVLVLGGRFSIEAGIYVDRGDREIERWFLAATLFGTRISTAIAIRTYRTLSDAGVSTIDEAAGRTWSELVGLLDAGGYARYDERTARRLLDLAAAVRSRFPDGIAGIGRTITDADEAAAALDELPGWGPSTVGAFLRELRGVWPAAALPVDERVTCAARHTGLVGSSTPFSLDQLQHLAFRAGIDPRDLEAGLLRLALAHHRYPTGDCSPGHAPPEESRPMSRTPTMRAAAPGQPSASRHAGPCWTRSARESPDSRPADPHAPLRRGRH